MSTSKELSTQYFTKINSKEDKALNVTVEVYKALGHPLICFSQVDGSALACLHFEPQPTVEQLQKDKVAKTLIAERTGKSKDLNKQEHQCFQGMITLDNQDIQLVITSLSARHIVFNVIRTDASGKPDQYAAINEINELRPFESYAIQSDQNVGNKAIRLNSVKEVTTNGSVVSITVERDEAKSVAKAKGQTEKGGEATYLMLNVAPEVVRSSSDEEKKDLARFAKTVWRCTSDFLVLRPIPPPQAFHHVPGPVQPSWGVESAGWGSFGARSGGFSRGFAAEPAVSTAGASRGLRQPTRVAPQFRSGAPANSFTYESYHHEPQIVPLCRNENRYEIARAPEQRELECDRSSTNVIMADDADLESGEEESEVLEDYSSDEAKSMTINESKKKSKGMGKAKGFPSASMSLFAPDAPVATPSPGFGNNAPPAATPSPGFGNAPPAAASFSSMAAPAPMAFSAFGASTAPTAAVAASGGGAGFGCFGFEMRPSGSDESPAPFGFGAAAAAVPVQPPQERKAPQPVDEKLILFSKAGQIQHTDRMVTVRSQTTDIQYEWAHASRCMLGLSVSSDLVWLTVEDVKDTVVSQTFPANSRACALRTRLCVTGTRRSVDAHHCILGEAICEFVFTNEVL